MLSLICNNFSCDDTVIIKLTMLLVFVQNNEYGTIRNKFYVTGKMYFG